MRTTLGEVLRQVDDLPWQHALYASRGAAFEESLPVLVWDVDDVVEGTELSEQAIELDYDYVLGIHEVQGIVANARAQRSDATTSDLLVAFAHYYANDGFVLWS